MKANRQAKKDNTKAQQAFIANKAQIDEMLGMLTALSDEHFNTSPETVGWGEVGSQEYAIKRLKEACQHFGLISEEA